jgi:cytochrome bd-type quinol oxidase subunit 2
MDGVDPHTLARAQFAFTVAFHIVFPAFSIGLASLTIWQAAAPAVSLGFLLVGAVFLVPPGHARC